ncbi:MAG TPA: hypothetical protein PLO37_09325 [Candidatus Hydrogenedentes bacterium]|nr:hypothetical protein [Candidatus Hydrogenedentota bacterium]HPG67031.1 hypothetical protein [Candidatus Hydrogenedentota bacterium]
MLFALLGQVVLSAIELPMGPAPEPVEFRHFPSRLHAYVWRNWPLVPTTRLAEVVGARPEDIEALGKAMGLADPPAISDDQWRRSYITIIRRNWHLLPYPQLTALLGWTAEQLDYALREGDGLFWWMGCYKPRLEPLHYVQPGDADAARAAQIAGIVRSAIPDGVDRREDPLFAFVERLSHGPAAAASHQDVPNRFSPRFCFSYFGAFRDPLSGDSDPYPDGYLERLAATGVNGVWLHEPLYRLSPFPWDESLSKDVERNRAALRDLVARARRHGLGVYLYFNEPRPMPVPFFDDHPDFKGVTDTGILAGQVATLCTSVPAVQDYLRDGVASLCRAVPDLGGLFTITASENYTNCWSHHCADECPRCKNRRPEEVIAEVNTIIAQGIAESGSACRLIAWDWGWRNEWAPGIIERLPERASLMSVSEWDLPITRGGVPSIVGEYSLSSVGPGPRAQRHWALARERGLSVFAKIQAGTCWELGSVPYIPAVENVAQHVVNLREANVEGLMMSWTLGGYPSPNLEAAIRAGDPGDPTTDEILLAVASRRFGDGVAPAVVRAWKGYSAALAEYPFSIGVLYNSPVHMGPANLLWPTPTTFRGSGTTGFAYPFDDVNTWRGPYPPDVFADQFDRVAGGFRQTIDALRTDIGAEMPPELAEELGVAEACAIHFQSVANQTRFVLWRDRLAQAGAATEAQADLDAIEAIVESEIDLACRLHALQSRDSRIGFEAACQYFYVGVDLGEKVLNCRDILDRWIPEMGARLANAAP